MTTDPGAVPPDANPLPAEEDLDWVVKGEQQIQHGDYQRSGSGQHATQPQASEEGTSLLAKEERNNEREIGNINSPSSSNHGNLHNRDLTPSAATQVLTGVAIASVAPAAAVGAGLVAMANSSQSVTADENEQQQPCIQAQQQQHPRGRRMCRRCKAFKPPRAHHCRYVELYIFVVQFCGLCNTKFPLLAFARDVLSKWIIIVLGSITALV